MKRLVNVHMSLVIDDNDSDEYLDDILSTLQYELESVRLEGLELYASSADDFNYTFEIDRVMVVNIGYEEYGDLDI